MLIDGMSYVAAIGVTSEDTGPVLSHVSWLPDVVAIVAHVDRAAVPSRPNSTFEPASVLDTVLGVVHFVTGLGLYVYVPGEVLLTLKGVLQVGTVALVTVDAATWSEESSKEETQRRSFLHVHCRSTLGTVARRH